jgi:hypothetical protein
LHNTNAVDFFKEAAIGKKIWGIPIEEMTNPSKTKVGDGLLHLRLTDGQLTINKVVSKKECIVKKASLFDAFKVLQIKTVHPPKSVKAKVNI